jgi:GTP:adenosylcobinamide-phosphate guanylyltransferase
MDALIVAGGAPKASDPLYPLTKDRPKGRIEIAGRPMVQWVIDAVAASPRIDRLLLIGLDPSASLRSAKPLTYLPEQGSLIGNARHGLACAAADRRASAHLMMVTADIPLITPEMVTFRADQIEREGADLDYCIIERTVMEARFPDSRRSYIHLRDLEACGGDIHGVRLDMSADNALWERLMDARKNALKQAWLLGPDTALMLLLRLATLARAEAMIGRRLGLRGKAQRCPFAEVGMDVDKPFQLEIVRRELESLRR